jgi:hypothetical protein
MGVYLGSIPHFRPTWELTRTAHLAGLPRACASLCYTDVRAPLISHWMPGKGLARLVTLLGGPRMPGSPPSSRWRALLESHGLCATKSTGAGALGHLRRSRALGKPPNNLRRSRGFGTGSPPNHRGSRGVLRLGIWLPSG